jgi:hydroxymethylglutaryl-CoA reductase
VSPDRLRIPEFYKLSVEERHRIVYERGLLNTSDFRALASGTHTLDLDAADKMIENVVGVMGLPLGLGMNLLVNDKQYVVPMVVEEPSVVAALGSAAKLIRACGGFRAEATDPILIGQIQVVNVPDMERAKHALRERRQEIINLANSFHPNMVARGGGARDIELFVHPLPSSGKPMLVVHLLVDTRDAMGANLVNGMCEGVAPLVESISGGEVFLRILSNLTDRALVRAYCKIPVERLAGRGYSGSQARDGIIVAGDFAAVDPYRAATHNKGIMNGIDAVVIATGNDWRGVEAGAHAFAATRGAHGGYGPLATWRVGEGGALEGTMEIPMAVGTVGGTLRVHPGARLALKLLGVERASDLGMIMAAVGMASNLAALRAMASEGIQRGHMSLHARSLALHVGAVGEQVDLIAEELAACGDVRTERAAAILQRLRSAVN